MVATAKQVRGWRRAEIVDCVENIALTLDVAVVRRQPTVEVERGYEDRLHAIVVSLRNRIEFVRVATDTDESQPTYIVGYGLQSLVQYPEADERGIVGRFLGQVGRSTQKAGDNQQFTRRRAKPLC